MQLAQGCRDFLASIEVVERGVGDDDVEGLVGERQLSCIGGVGLEVRITAAGETYDRGRDVDGNHLFASAAQIGHEALPNRLVEEVGLQDAPLVTSAEPGVEQAAVDRVAVPAQE
jgi:hypothetical protein